MSSRGPAQPLPSLSSRDWINIFSSNRKQEVASGLHSTPHSIPPPGQRPPAPTAHYSHLGLFNINARLNLRDSYSAGRGGVQALIRTSSVILMCSWPENQGSVQARGQQSFSVNSQITNILGCVGHLVPEAAAQLCSCSMKAAVDNT